MVQWLGYSVAEVSYWPRDRQAGHTKFSMFRLLGYSLDAVVSFSRVPLRLAFLLGFFFLLFGLGVIARGVLGAVVPGWEVSGWTVAIEVWRSRPRVGTSITGRKGAPAPCETHWPST